MEVPTGLSQRTCLFRCPFIKRRSVFAPDFRFYCHGKVNRKSIFDELTDFLLYTAPNGDIKVEVILNNETVWLTQKAIATLFGVQVPAISKHLKNIFENAELDEKSVVSILETTAADGKNYNSTAMRMFLPVANAVQRLVLSKASVVVNVMPEITDLGDFEVEGKKHAGADQQVNEPGGPTDVAVDRGENLVQCLHGDSS